MESETTEALYRHHQQCGGFEFTKSVLQRDSEGTRYYRYRCQKCGYELREALPVEPVQRTPPMEKAA